jgi:hypothetical protein
MSNIQIIGDIIQQTQLSRISVTDIGLLSSENISENFGLVNDYIEYHIIDSAGNLQSSNYNYQGFTLSPSVGINPINNGLPTIEIDPLNDIQSVGYNIGQFTTQYNFFRNKLSSTAAELFISDISADRTELRLASNILSNQIINNAVGILISEITNDFYYPDILLNLGSNRQYLIVNIALDTTGLASTILVKLYEPLPVSITLKQNLWIVEEIIDAYIFDINLTKLIIPDPIPTISGPNFDIEINTKNNKVTNYENYTSLLVEISQSQNQILNYLNQQSIEINTDYTNFEQFIHFGSAQARITNFYNKVQQIENYNNFISSSNSITGSTPNIINDISSSLGNITTLITNFDAYETYLYFESSSFTYPKISSNKPYILQSTGSAQSISWFNNNIISASLYDQDNLDNLINTIPDYIKDDINNVNYLTFINLIGHYFDNIWIYLTAITNIYENKNNPTEGVSKNIVQYMLQSLGMKLYNNDSDNLASYIVGANSGSNEQYNISDKDLLEETYRRLYHNLPYLNQTKGTIPGLRALITCFGIPSAILDINEFGGNNQSSSLEISEISNNKIRIINNIVSGSVLSPLLKIENTPDSQLVNDLPYLDISFNPNKPLNNAIKTAISNSFNIDDYIGDPSLETCSSYQNLISFQHNQYNNYNKYLSVFNHSQYIELVSYFDNSLFKMIQDFVPERSNTSIGILIESPILERNKIPRTQPCISTQSVYEADYNGPTIGEDNSYLYSKISGSRQEFYNGELTGSEFDINEDFFNANINPYLNHQASFTQKTFKHSEFWPLFNNVSESLKSKIRLELEPIYNNGLIIGEISNSYAEIQDSDLTLTSYQNSRYLGTKVSSLFYNNYTSASSTYVGDTSYGKTAAIDYNVSKLGLLSQVTESQFLGGFNNVTVKYLVDNSGSLTELNQNNNNWEEVQNTFMAGDILTISLFDNQKFSNQKSTDGVKYIYNSGYNYYPVLYLSNSDTTMSFNFASPSASNNQFKAVIVGNGYGINSGSEYNLEGPNGETKYLYNIYENTNTIHGGYNNGDNYTPSTNYENISHYIVPSLGAYSFQANIVIKAETGMSEKTATLSLSISSSDGQLNLPFYVSDSAYSGGVFDYPFIYTFDLSLNVPSKTYASGTIISFSVAITSPGEVDDFLYTPIKGYAESSLLGGAPIITGSFINAITNNMVILNPEFTPLLNSYQFNPSGSNSYVGSKSSLYNKYGQVEYPFDIDEGDLIQIITTGGDIYVFPISGYTIDASGSIEIDSTNIPSDLAPNSISEFMLLQEIEDETNIILQFNKALGQTSLGFIIPSNINTDVIDNINTITTNVKQKLIDLGDAVSTS